jgi:hypothetical protein
MRTLRWLRRASIGSTAFAVGTMSFALPGHADEPALHHVRYTVGASQPLRAEIYYRDTQPATVADYSHDPYSYEPNVEAALGPGKAWVLETELANPDDWAMVIATAPEFHGRLDPPGFVREVRVDGIVKATNAGTNGARCSVRSW